jgi:Zn-dependent protease
VTTTPAVITCPRCAAQVAPGLLACPSCAWLTHGDELTRLAREAEAAESAGDASTALATWRRTLELLPQNTVQREKITERMRGLSAAVDGRGGAQGGKRKGSAAGGAAAGAGVVGLFLLKSKALLLVLLANAKLLVLGLLKLPMLLSALFYLQFRSFGSAPGVGLGIVICIYVHEMGHVAALKRYGIEATAPMFIPGFGALIRLKQYPTDAHEDARTGLAGPLWGLVASAVAALAGHLGGWPLAVAVGSLSAMINLFNLLPVWQLDGSRGLHALSRFERLIVAGTGVVVGSVLHQWMPLIVGLVAGARAFGGDAHPTGDRGMLWLFVALIVALGLVATLPITAAFPVRT